MGATNMPEEKRDGFEERPRRILELDVQEVSIVDRPAILRRFLVTKRRTEERTMGAFEPTNEEVKKNAEKEAAEKAAAEKAAAEKEAAEKAAVEKGTIPDKGAIADFLKGLEGAEGATVKEVIAHLQNSEKGAMPPWLKKPGAGDKEEKKKSEGGDDMVVVKADGSIHVRGEAVEKRRQFTAARIQAMKETTLQLAGLINEVAPDVAKEIAAALKELPSNAKVPQAVKPTGTAKEVTKSEGLEKENEELKKSVAELTKRLDDIEKTRPVSKSAEAEGGTDSPKPKGESFWKGVL
jgi:hypothetical protein